MSTLDRLVEQALAETLPERLKRLRLERCLSQRELACPGVSYAYISRIEAGTRNPSVKALRRLAEKLGVTADYLETGEERFCVSVPRIVADELFRDGARDGALAEEFGLDDLATHERALIDHELEVTLMRSIRSLGFSLSTRRGLDGDGR